MDYYYKFTTTPGLYGVITTDIISKEFWDVAADLGFYKSSNQTSINPYNFNTNDYPANMLLSFGVLTFSPYFKLKIPVKSFTPYIFIGPRIDYYYSKLSSDDANSFNDQITKKPLLGFNVGEGIAYKINRLSIFAEYQYMFSFNYLIDIPGYTASDPKYGFYTVNPQRLKINTHVVTLGFKYYFKE